MSIKSYPKYKDSGVEWLGMVPEGWEVKRARAVGCFSSSGIDKKSVDGEEPVQMFNYLDVYKSISKVLNYSPELMWTTAPSEKIKEHAVQDGDILLTPSSETEDDIGHAAQVAPVEGKVVYSYHLIRFRPKSWSCSKFLTYFFNSKPIRSYFESVCTGTTRMVLVREDFKSTPFCLPDAKEQSAIASFLDHETSKIDALISEQEKLIELLKEKRSAVISHAVTKGLNPDVKMKESGVEWLGMVPEGWEIAPNKALLTHRHSIVGETCDSKLLLSLTLNGVIPRDMETPKGKFPTEFDTYQDVDANDLVFCLFDMDETPRTVGIARESGMITGAYDVFHCKQNAVPAFVLYYYLHIDASKGLRPFYTGLRKVVRSPTFMSVKIPLPPVAEQSAIASFLDHETSKIDALTTEAQHGIDLLQERRSALISAAVTGQIDVRDFNPSKAA